MQFVLAISIGFILSYLANSQELTDNVIKIINDLGYSPVCVSGALATCEKTASSGNKGFVDRPVNCADLLAKGDKTSGVRTVYPIACNRNQPVSVFCDQTTDGGGWTVIQKRDSTTKRENFYRTWAEYVSGFGSPTGEFWLGLDNIHALVNPNLMELRIDLEEYEGGKRWAKYGIFHVGGSKSNYVLSIASYSGDAGDSLDYQNGMQFTTHDADHDLNPDGNCAKEYRGAWWHNHCLHSNLNGFQHEGEHTSHADGIHWHTFRGLNYSLKKTVMAVRPKYKITSSEVPPIHSTNSAKLVQCGTSNKLSDQKIVKGYNARPRDWPWMASIRHVKLGHQCGGSLISDIHILTAAHCFNTFTKDDVIVRLGEHDFDKDTDDNPIDFKVIDVRKHKKFNSSILWNDIAILKLDRPVTFGEFIHPVCLPPTNDNLEGLFGYAIGWGAMHFQGSATNILQEVGLIVWPLKECVAKWPSNIVIDSNLCIGHLPGKEGDSCGGDSGGPFLVQTQPDRKWYVAGIVSYGHQCGIPNLGAVYTRVNMYIDWIEENTL